MLDITVACGILVELFGRRDMEILKFCKKNPVMTTSFVIALISSFFVPPDKAYLGYIDLKTIVCLFIVLSVVCALRDADFFYVMAQKIVALFKTTRNCIMALVLISLVGSMLITNDTALLTFLPLGYFVLSTTGKEKHLAFTFIMQTLAANLGGMLTPFGNPQNLYLYTSFNISTAEFLRIMLPPFTVSLVLIFFCCVFVKNEPLEIVSEHRALNKKKTALFLGLFGLAVLVVLRLVSYWIGLAVITAVLFFADRNALKKVDYTLMATFVFFFVFAGNMARIDVVQRLFSMLLEKNTILVSALLCQIISNVPAAILLSQFTENYAGLLVGVNIGGVGTIIASLASLITLNEYGKHVPKGGKAYLLKFSTYNFAFLAILLLAMKLF